MRDYDPAKSFDADSARYHDVRGDEEEAVAFLLSRAGDRRSLELAIGTGRIAIPLAAAGLNVEGIDIAPAMLDRMREKPGGSAIPARLGNIVDVDVDGSFGFVFVLWNTFFNLITQADQRRCFENVAARLDPGGLFLIEAYTPDPFFKLDGNQEIKTEAVGNSSVRIGALRHDPATQVIEQNHVTLSAHGMHFAPVVQRYVWPSEMDLMAELAGLSLVERFGGWREEPFTAKSDMHVSVYARD